MTPQEAAAAAARIIPGCHVLLSDDIHLFRATALAHADAHNDDFGP